MTINPATMICFRMVRSFCFVILALLTTVLMLSLQAAAMPASLARVIGIAGLNATQVLGFVLLCGVVGLVVRADRRRRRQARSSAA